MTVLSWYDAVYASGKGSRQGRWQLRIPGSRAGSSAELSSCWRLHHRPQPHSLLIIYYIAVKSPPGRGHTHDRGLPGPRAVAVSLLAHRAYTPLRSHSSLCFTRHALTLYCNNAVHNNTGWSRLSLVLAFLCDLPRIMVTKF